MIFQPGSKMIQPKQANYIQGGPMAPGGGGMMKQMMGMGLKSALSGSPMAPMASFLGGLFNEGGQVPWGKDITMTEPWPGPNTQADDMVINGNFTSSHTPNPLAPRNNMAMPFLSSFNEGGQVPWWKRVAKTVWGSGPKKGSIADQINWGGQNKNMGGPIAAQPNPYGYNEGGAVTERPIKKVMDEQKLEQQAMAFELDEGRKAEKHELDMKLKQQQFEMAQKMKKASATTSKQPTKPKGPLSK